MNAYILTIVVSLFCLTMLTRSFPFLFSEKLAGNTMMKVVGKRLTAYIMMLLVIYEINPVSFNAYPYGLPAMLSLLLVILVHLLLRKPLLSMLFGTLSFILLNLHYT
jgi:branched-subunit amino acid transport protein AzlD